jgi:hypothetical protein
MGIEKSSLNFFKGEISDAINNARKEKKNLFVLNIGIDENSKNLKKNFSNNIKLEKYLNNFILIELIFGSKGKKIFYN